MWYSLSRFLVRLLLVHGTLADYRLGRLIKYSFYKNIAFAFIFLFFQPFNGVSGQVCMSLRIRLYRPIARHLCKSPACEQDCSMYELSMQPM